MSMTQELRDKWIAALRSGEYPQARKFLRASDGFCCLGVLCAVAGEDKFVKAPEEYCMIDPEVEIRLGLAESTGDLYIISAALAEMNDGDAEAGVTPKSFTEIADWIESNL